MNLPDIVLLQPEIPPNTGNVIRLCANTGACLHLIHPLGFRLEDRRLRRAGLDYAEVAAVEEHASLEAYLKRHHPRALYGLSAHGSTPYDRADAGAADALLFGCETQGLSAAAWRALPPERRLYIPMLPGSRSMNLANSVAVVVYDCWRRSGFPGAAG
jgi:tRNA (cytidine/uridine-2'-O-)-methyltransferase